MEDHMVSTPVFPPHPAKKIFLSVTSMKNNNEKRFSLILRHTHTHFAVKGFGANEPSQNECVCVCVFPPTGRCSNEAG